MHATEKIENRLSVIADFIAAKGIGEGDFEVGDFRAVMHVFSKGLPEYRTHLGKVKYPLESLILMSMLSKVMWKNDSFLEMSSWCRAKRAWLWEMGVISGDETPSHDTFRRFFMLFDGKALKDAFVKSIDRMLRKLYKAAGGKEGLPTMASVDGKELRGSGRKGENPVGNLATLNVYIPSSGLCLFEIPIEKKESEMTAFREFIPSFNLKNHVVTADALHLQRETAALITRKGGRYVMAIKKNQKALLEEAMARLSGQRNPAPIKRVHRDFYVYRMAKSYIGEEWPGQALYIRMVSRVRHAKAKDRETEMYFLSSCRDATLSIEAIENRWEIENGYHRGKDLQLGEDRFRSADKKAVDNMAKMNSVLMAMYGTIKTLLGLKQNSEARVYVACDPERYLGILFKALKGRSLSDMVRRKIEESKR